MVIVVDYGMGNLRSVSKALESLGVKVRVSDRPQAIKKAKRIVFPGVGHFGKAVCELKKRKIFNVLIERIEHGIPFLGICLGLQLLFEESEEAPGMRGLSVVKGRVQRFSSGITPHMGWNQVKTPRSPRVAGRRLGKGIPDKSYFYFAHSYYVKPEEKRVVWSQTSYGKNFCSAIAKDNIIGVQFHPEKSQHCGLQFLKNFLSRAS